MGLALSLVPAVVMKSGFTRGPIRVKGHVNWGRVGVGI